VLAVREVLAENRTMLQKLLRADSGDDR